MSQGAEPLTSVKGSLIPQSIPSVPLISRRPRRPHASVLTSLALSVILPLAALVKYGWDLHPEWLRFVDAAQHWTTIGASPLLAVGDRALLANFLPAWIAGALQLSSEGAYVAFSIALTGLALMLPILLRLRESSPGFAQLYVLVCVGGSLAPVLAMWVGGYDALLAIFLIIGALSRNRVIAAAGWLLASFTHSAVALPAALVWCMFLLVQSQGWRSRTTWTTAGTATAACLLGFLAIRSLTDLWGGSTDRFTLWRAIPFDGILQCYAQAFPAIMFSALGIIWVLVLLPPIRRVACTPAFFALALATALLVPLIAVDETRITALVLLPLTLAWIERVGSSVDAHSLTRMWRWMLIPALLMPVCVVWMGTAHWPYWM